MQKLFFWTQAVENVPKIIAHIPAFVSTVEMIVSRCLKTAVFESGFFRYRFSFKVWLSGDWKGVEANSLWHNRQRGQGSRGWVPLLSIRAQLRIRVWARPPLPLCVEGSQVCRILSVPPMPSSLRASTHSALVPVQDTEILWQTKAETLLCQKRSV